MTKLVVEIRSDKQTALGKAILRFFNITILKEEIVEEKPSTDIESFYNQFNLDLSSFKFNRQEANER